jgi:hypothetical protein
MNQSVTVNKNEAMAHAYTGINEEVKNCEFRYDMDQQNFRSKDSSFKKDSQEEIKF